MKKIITLVLALAVIIGLSFYVYNLNKNAGTSDEQLSLIEFAIEDVTTVDKVIISDAFGRTFEIIKNGDEWTDKDGNCVIQESARLILEAFKNIEFKGYLADNSITQFTKIITTQHTKVEIFQNGEWTKTWYIGPPAQDHYGQVMLIDSKEGGKSDAPVLMKIKGMNGIIEPRFFADARKWECTNIFSIPLNELAKVEVKFNDEPERSFSVTKSGSDMKVYQQGKLLNNVDTSMIFRYLNNYQKIHFDIPNYVLNEKQIDSLKATTPFCVLKVKETNGKSTKLKFYRIMLQVQVDQGITEYSDKDRDRFWCELPTGEIVKCQYFVFNPLILGHIYFPMDISMLKTHDGMLKKE
ncbi:MAG: hypothetical protein QNL61_09725 [Crocinitomicaceae bacterium]